MRRWPVIPGQAVFLTVFVCENPERSDATRPPVSLVVPGRLFRNFPTTSGLRVLRACHQATFAGIPVAPFGGLDLILGTNPSTIATADTTIAICMRTFGNVDRHTAPGEVPAESTDARVLLYPNLVKACAGIAGELNLPEPQPGYNLKSE